MTPLGRILARRIAAEGPITVAAYMAEALGHPRYGYYMQGDPFGRAGDFTTAPEISQMFGELIGLWCAETWRTMGAPAPVNLVELGPGRGTLMADLLRAAAVLPGFRAAATIHLVETSPALRDRQRETLQRDAEAVFWHDDLASVPDGPLLLVANEFFDALPVHQLQKTDKGWRERLVAPADETGETFRLALAPGPAPHEVLISDPLRRDAPTGAVVEVSPAGIAIAAAIAERIARCGGAALIVDYGHAETVLHPTLQAVRRHRRHDVLSAPGSADLTAHVDFAALTRAAGARGRVYGPITQAALLARLGIELRAERLLATATAAQACDIRAARQRLIGETEMGTLFKALAIAHPELPPPPGFEQDPPSATA